MIWLWIAMGIWWVFGWIVWLFHERQTSGPMETVFNLTFGLVLWPFISLVDLLTWE